MSDYFGGCAYCTSRTAERYEEFPRCTECGEHVCEHCASLGATVFTDYDRHEWTLACRACGVAEA